MAKKDEIIRIETLLCKHKGISRKIVLNYKIFKGIAAKLTALIKICNKD
jgi:hypothetical protein